jgi:ABC-type glycerol-3-phosphate transport system substrate-binding protein
MMAVASDIFTPYIQKAIVGELTPQEAMDAAAKEAQELIEGKR